jgi:hypothetical protein
MGMLLLRTTVVSLVFVTVQPALAQEPGAVDAGRRAAQTVTAVEGYFKAHPAEPAGESELDAERRVFRGFARQLESGMRRAALVAGERDPATFAARFRAPGDDAVDAAAAAGLHRFVLRDGTPRCCDELTAASAPAEHALAVTLEGIWKGFGDEELAATIARMAHTYDRFESKLLKGFPAMPWEYMFNFQGTRDGPSRHQLIWLHPNVATEVDRHALDGTSHVRPSFAVQVIGYNFYVFRGINYVGATTLLTVNATAGRDRWRRGGAVHLGNILSVGATRGDGHWTWYVASDRLADKLVGALVKTR